MTRLLVSVRSAEEAAHALAGGADVIDVKEPNRGSLGRSDPAVWREVAGVASRESAISWEIAGDKLVAGPANTNCGAEIGRLGARNANCGARSELVPLSAALGELREWRCGDFEPRDLSGFQFAKLGLAGCADMPDWRMRWAEAIAALPSSVRPVAVSYADWRLAEAPPPEEVIDTGARLGCAAWLIDTFTKTGGGLLDHIALDDLARLIARARAAKMLTVLAGSLTPTTIKTVLPLAPDYLAVRGAACPAGREGKLDPQSVRRLAALVRGRSEPPKVKKTTDDTDRHG